MSHSVPPLTAKQPGRVVRAASAWSSKVRLVVDQIVPYTAHWNERNQIDLDRDGPLLISIGDSTALGIGASKPENSYIGRLGSALEQRDGRSWRIINLSQSGARLTDGLERQLPALQELPEADLLVCCLGSNDLSWSLDVFTMVKRMGALIGGLPENSIVAAAAGRSAKANRVNGQARSAAAQQGFPFVDPWAEPGPGPLQRLAPDKFHPNDLGYTLMARPLARQVGAPEPQLPTGSAGDGEPSSENRR